MHKNSNIIQENSIVKTEKKKRLESKQLYLHIIKRLLMFRIFDGYVTEGFENVYTKEKKYYDWFDKVHDIEYTDTPHSWLII